MCRTRVGSDPARMKNWMLCDHAESLGLDHSLADQPMSGGHKKNRLRTVSPKAVVNLRVFRRSVLVWAKAWFIQQVGASLQDSFFLCVNLRQSFRLDLHVRLTVQTESRSRGNQMAENHIFF